MCFLGLGHCKCCICLNKKKIEEQDNEIKEKIKQLQILEDTIKRLEEIKNIDSPKSKLIL